MNKFNFALTKPFDLQMFADPAPAGTEPSSNPEGNDPAGNDPAVNNQNSQDPKPEPKYTEQDLDRIIGRKFAAWQKQQEKAQKERDEAERLKNMSDEEKQKRQMQSMQDELNNLKREKALGEMAKTARGLLAEKHINVSDELISNLISTDAESTKSAVDSFAAAFDKAVQDAVAEKLKGKAPAAGSTGKKLTKEEILKVKDTRERQKLISEHMDLFQAK